MNPGRTGALLLAALGPAALTPLAMIDMLWLGPQMLVAGAWSDPVFTAFGIAVLIGGAVPPLCWALAALAWGGSRRALTAGAALALILAALTLTPLCALSPIAWLPAGRWLALALALLTAAVLIRSLRLTDDAGPLGTASRLVPALSAGFVAAVAVAGLPSAWITDAIPNVPSGLLADEMRGGERLRGQPLEVGPAPPSFGLMPGQGSNIHNDSAMSDVYRGRHVVDPAAAELRSFLAPGDCASILFDDEGRLIAVCVGGTQIVAYVLDPRTLEPLAKRRVGERSVGLDFATNFAGGGYAALDRKERLIVPGADGVINRFRIGSGDAPAITPLDSFDVAYALKSGEPITSALPDSVGRIWFVGADGTVGILDTASGSARSVHFDDSEIENSFAFAPNGDAFVATSRKLVRLSADRHGPLRVVWEEEYDDGLRRKPGQTSRGSGTTPTVMLGGHFVAITDNAEPRMNVLVFDARPKSDGRRLVCKVPVFAAGKSATENSLIAAGNAIFVENNYGYKLFAVLGGHTGEPGAARIDLDAERRACVLAWSNDEIRIPSVVSKVSAADGTMLTYTKPASVAGIDPWYFTAVDAGSGEVLWERRAGSGALANNHYAALYVGPRGELYVGTLGGVIGLVDPDD